MTRALAGTISSPSIGPRTPLRRWLPRVAIAAAVAAGVGMLVAYDIARNAAGVLMRRGSILTHDCETGAGPCPSGYRCFRLYSITYDCDSDTFGDTAWTPGQIACLPEGTSTALNSAPSGDANFPCLLWKWVASRTCCSTVGDSCDTATFTPPAALPTNAEAAACCCCPCPDDCNDCADTRTATVAGSGVAYPAGCDGTFTLKACRAPRGIGDPCVNSLPDCQWFLAPGDGSGNNDVTLSCDFISVFRGAFPYAIAGWVVSTSCGKFVNKGCCPNPFPGCPPSGAYVNPDIPGITVTVT